MSTHNLCFEQKCGKYQNLYLKTFRFFGGVFINIYLNRCVFVAIQNASNKPLFC